MDNLIKWHAGTSGNPLGRPKGSKNIKSLVRDMLTSQSTFKKLPLEAPGTPETPLEAIICVLISQALQGDIRASDTLLKYATDRNEVASQSVGFFSHNELIVRVVGSDYGIQSEHSRIDTTTGQLIQT